MYHSLLLAYYILRKRVFLENLKLGKTAFNCDLIGETVLFPTQSLQLCWTRMKKINAS